jgi:hypothetical protein
MTDDDRLLSRKARQLGPSSLDAATRERLPSLFDEKALGARRADHPFHNEKTHHRSCG